MSKLTEIKKKVESFYTDSDVDSVLGTIDELEYLLSLLEEKDKALSFYASEKTYRLGVQITMGAAYPLHEPIKADKGLIARTALNTTKEETDNE